MSENREKWSRQWVSSWGKHTQAQNWDSFFQDWPDGVIAVATYITDAQVVYHHQDYVGPPAHLLRCDITSYYQEQGEKKMCQQGGPSDERFNTEMEFD